MLLPMGFGTILVNIPFSDALTGPIRELYEAGIANELFPLLMHSNGVNVSGQIASVIAGGIILNIAAKLMGG